MLCPEVNNFSPPKTLCSIQRNVTLDKTVDRIKLNNFYRSVILTFPDELNIPNYIQEAFLDDSDYYKIINCSIINFIDPVFVESFIKKGKVYCLSIHKNCLNHNAIAITPDGILTIHVLKSVYQILGIEGTKRPHDFYEIKADLWNLKHIDKLKNSLNKLEDFSCYISWEPANDNVCPSSIAKYFCDKNYKVTQHSLETTNLSPNINEIPSLDADIDEVVEWMGMIAHNGNLMPEENYISTYYVPESSKPLQTTRISVLVIRGFITPNIMSNTCKWFSEHVLSRDLENYWSALSVQTVEESLYQWHTSSPRMFQSHNSSCNIFFTQDDQIIYSVSQLKYS